MARGVGAPRAFLGAYVVVLCSVCVCVRLRVCGFAGPSSGVETARRIAVHIARPRLSPLLHVRLTRSLTRLWHPWPPPPLIVPHSLTAITTTTASHAHAVSLPPAPRVASQVDVVPVGLNGEKAAAVNYFREGASFLISPVSPVGPVQA